MPQVLSAWNEVQRRHEALRTGFCRAADQLKTLIAVVRKKKSIPSAVAVAATTKGREMFETQAARDIVEHIEIPAWRVNILQRERRLIMVLSMHHALYDAEGLRIIISDLHCAFEGEVLPPEISTDALLLANLGRPVDEIAPTVQFWSDMMLDAR